MTFAELVQESEMYEYSNEYYELVKECAEITVMEQFIKSQKFIAENKKIVESVSKTSGADFFTESVSADNIAMLEATVKNKGNKVGDFIWKKLVLLWDALRKMVTNIWNKISGQEQTKLRAKFIEYINMHSDDSQLFAKKAINIASKYDVTCSSEARKYQILDSRAISSLNDKEIIYLNSALRDDFFSIEGKFIPLTELTSLVNKLIFAENVNNLVSVSALFDRLKDGNELIIPIKEKDMTKIIKDMNKLKDEIDKALLKKTENYYSGDSVSEFYSKFQYLSTEIFKYITNDINGLRNAAMFRSEVLKNFNSIINGNNKFDKKAATNTATNDYFDDEDE